MPEQSNNLAESNLEFLTTGQVFVARRPERKLTPNQLEVFLIELLNLQRTDPRAVSRFVRRFADYGLLEPRIMLPTRAEEDASLLSGVEDLIVPYLHDIFSACWVEPDPKSREWGWMIFRTQWTQIRFPDLSSSLRDDGGRKRFPPPPEESPIEKAFQYLLRHHHQTRYCLYPECNTPYFFAKRHTQKYCSEKCAQSGERETKRKWWAEHGADWRKQQRHAAASTTRKKTAKKGKRGK